MVTDPSSFLAMNAPPTRMRAGHALHVAALFGVGAVNAVQAPCTLDPAFSSNSASQPLECMPVDVRHDGPKPKTPIEAQKTMQLYGSGYEARGLKAVDDRATGLDAAASSPRVGAGENRFRVTTGLAGRPYGGDRGGGAGARRGR